MTDLNSVSLTGRLTADPQVNQFQDGGAIMNFSVAVNHSVKNQDGTYKDEADFFNVSYSSKGAAKFAQYMPKGTKVVIEGRLTVNSWTDKQTGQKRSNVVIKATNVIPMSNPQNAQQNGFNRVPQQQYQQQPMQQQYQQQMPNGVQQGFNQAPQQYQQQPMMQQQGMGGFQEDIPF